MCKRILSTLIFLSSMAVYDGQAKAGGTVEPADQTTPASIQGKTGEVSLLSSGSVPTTNPATQPANEGQSVKAEDVHVGDEGIVEIHVNDANLIEVLRMLSLQSKTNILPSKDVHGSVTANLYGVTIREALDAILTANGYAYKEKGNIIYVYTAAELADKEKKERKASTEVFHLHWTTAVNVQVLIKPVLSEAGQVAITAPAQVGIASDPTSAGGNSVGTEDTLVVTDYPDYLEKVRKIIKEIDVRPQQILIEATILSATLNDNNALGVDFTLLGGVSFANLANNAGSSSTPVGDALTGQIVNNPQASAITHNGYSALGTSFTNNVPQGGLRVGVVTNNVAAFVSALESTTDTVVLANPKVLVVNKMKGEVKVAREDAYRGKITTSESGVSTQEVDFLETGTVLIFRPFIADDGNIRLEIHPEDSTPLAAASSDLPPTKATTEATSNVIVKDGHTIVIGGMFREQTQIVRNQIPYLGTLPVIGPMFRSQQDVTTRTEVIILLTPHIVSDDQAYSALSEQQLKDLDRMRVGVRHGMMIIGRERLADTHYEAALAEMKKPHPNTEKAIWQLDCATNLNPRFIEAIDLKEKLTGKAVTAADNSSIRSFVEQCVLSDKSIPATQPSGATAHAANPATHPSLAASPATRPATQPSEMAKASPATRPSEPAKTAEAESGFTDQFRDLEQQIMTALMNEADAAANAEATAANAPATQPAQAAAKTDDAGAIHGANKTQVNIVDDSADDAAGDSNK